MDLGQINWFDFLILGYQEKAQIILNLLLLASTFGLQPVYQALTDTENGNRVSDKTFTSYKLI